MNEDTCDFMKCIRYYITILFGAPCMLLYGVPCIITGVRGQDTLKISIKLHALVLHNDFQVALKLKFRSMGYCKPLEITQCKICRMYCASTAKVYN